MAESPRTMAAVGWVQVWRSMRAVEQLLERHPQTTGFMLYRAAEAGLPTESSPLDWVALDQISPYVLCAVIGAEDPVFFRHRGIWWGRVRRAVIQAYRRSQDVRGVSTITQQLARNLYLHPERSIRRKVQEAVIACQLERKLTKRRILEIYLNVVEWGIGVWGISAAAREYFSAAPADLDAFQAIVLASLLPAPRRPLRERNAERALRSQRRLLIYFYGAGLLSPGEQQEIAQHIAKLERAIGEGQTARHALRQIVQAPRSSADLERWRPSVQDVLAHECGWERWLRFRATVRESTSQRRGLEDLLNALADHSNKVSVGGLADAAEVRSSSS